MARTRATTWPIATRPSTIWRSCAKRAHSTVIPGTSLWWLEHYAQFHEHPRCRYRCIVHEPEYAAFSLEETLV